MTPTIPAVLQSELQLAPVISPVGTRRPGFATRQALAALLYFIPDPGKVYAADATGVDELVRRWRGEERLGRVFRSASRTPRDLVVRTTDHLRATADADGVWITFPDCPKPDHIELSKSWPRQPNWDGIPRQVSGSWSGLSMALARGMRCAVFLPPPIGVPASWPLQATELAGWWTSDLARPRARKEDEWLI